MASLSRSEDILLSKINGTTYNQPAQSRVEKLLLQLNTGTGVDTTELTKEVSELQGKVEANQSKISYLDTSMTKNANNISGLKTSVTATQNKIMNAEQKMETLSSGVDELNRNIRDVQEDVIWVEDHAILDSIRENKED